MMQGIYAHESREFLYCLHKRLGLKGLFYVYKVLMSLQAGSWEDVFLFGMDMMDMLFMSQQGRTLSNKAFLWNYSYNIPMTETFL